MLCHSLPEYTRGVFFLRLGCHKLFPINHTTVSCVLFHKKYALYLNKIPQYLFITRHFLGVKFKE